jgi:hypothetical protein
MILIFVLPIIAIFIIVALADACAASQRKEQTDRLIKAQRDLAIEMQMKTAGTWVEPAPKTGWRARMGIAYQESPKAVAKRMTKHILFLAALGLALSATGAQAQEYQSQSTVRYPGYEKTTYEDGSTTTSTWRRDNQTGAITNEDIVRTHATPAPTPVPPARNPSHVTHNSSERSPVVAAPAKAQIPVTVIEGAMTPEEIRRLVNGE